MFLLVGAVTFVHSVGVLNEDESGESESSVAASRQAVEPQNEEVVAGLATTGGTGIQSSLVSSRLVRRTSDL